MLWLHIRVDGLGFWFVTLFLFWPHVIYWRNVFIFLWYMFILYVFLKGIYVENDRIFCYKNIFGLSRHRHNTWSYYLYSGSEIHNDMKFVFWFLHFLRYVSCQKCREGTKKSWYSENIIIRKGLVMLINLLILNIDVGFWKWGYCSQCSFALHRFHIFFFPMLIVCICVCLILHISRYCFCRFTYTRKVCTNTINASLIERSFDRQSLHVWWHAIFLQ